MKEVIRLIERVERHCDEIKSISKSIDDIKSAPEIRTLKILLAIDGSKKSEEAVDYALNLAMQTYSKITVLNIVKKPEESPLGEVLVNEKAMFIRSYGIEATTRVESGNVAENILRIADEIGAGMIVLGLNGSGGLKGALLGNVSERVLDEAKIPVLVVR